MTLIDFASSAHGSQASAWTATQDLISDVSIEATPSQIAKSAELGRLAPSCAQVYLPLLPGSKLTDSLESCRSLTAMGLRPVPHLVARACSGMAELDDVLPRMVEAGVDTVLLLAGDTPSPLGPFENTLQLLETGVLERHGIRRLGVAGHPDGHTHADEDELFRAIETKADYAARTGSEMWLVTQFVFDSRPLTNWDAKLRERGVDIPIRVGLAGPASLRAVMGFALRCGVAASARALARRPEATKLLGRWNPSALLGEIADYASHTPETLIRGVHIFPFGGLDASVNWIHDTRATDIAPVVA